MILFHPFFTTLNERGKQVTPFKYDQASTYEGGYAAVGMEDEPGSYQISWAIINYEGKELTPFKYDQISYHYTWKYSLAKLNGKYGFIDDKGKEVTPFKYSQVSENFYYNEKYANYLFVKEAGGKFGVINQYGKELTPMKYEGLKGCFDCGGGLQGKLDGQWVQVELNK